MDDTAEKLRTAVRTWTARLEALEEDEAAAPRDDGGWSPKQVVGHLIDSAQVNLERFLRSRDSDHLDLPAYPQDEWVLAGDYARAPWAELVALWGLLNLQVARVIEGTPAAARDRVRTRHSCDRIAFLTVPRGFPITLAIFMEDYVLHLEHHLVSLNV